jgi:hypothetical protein
VAGCDREEITLPAEWAKYYRVIADPAATASFYFIGEMASKDILKKGWVRPGFKIVVQSLSDHGGAPASYADGKWTIGGGMKTTSVAQLASITSDWNTIFKRDGQTVRVAPASLYVAQGNGAAATWIDVHAGTVQTPIEQAWTATHVSRMSVAPSTKLRNVLDKINAVLTEYGY